jgi:hypothetical protein
MHDARQRAAARIADTVLSGPAGVNRRGTMSSAGGDKPRFAVRLVQQLDHRLADLADGVHPPSELDPHR